MVGYKLSKNDWVTPFFVIFRSVREILLVTVFCKHPVAALVDSVLKIRTKTCLMYNPIDTVVGTERFPITFKRKIPKISFVTFFPFEPD